MMRKLYPVLALIGLLSTHAFADNAPVVTKMGNVTIINSGPTTITKVSPNVTVMDSASNGPPITLTVPSGSNVYVPNYNNGNMVYVPQNLNTNSVYMLNSYPHYCNAYGCY